MPIPPPSRDATCVVTGASSGLGTALARRLSRRGHHVTLVARRADRLGALADELGDATAMPCDLADAPQREALIAALQDGARRVDVLVNNAGFGTLGHYLDADPAREREMIGVNVDAPVALCRAFAPAMATRRNGAILTVASIAAFSPLPGMSLYAGTKSLLLSFSSGLHAELASHGVTVTVMCPGGIRTEFADVAGGASLAKRLPASIWMNPDAVAAHGLDGLDRGRFLVVPGRINRVGGLIARHVPRPLLVGVAARAMTRRAASTSRF
jgi:short-subunit dehydrogenase